jgi:hypothetical protein
MTLIERGGGITIPQTKGYEEEIRGRNLRIAVLHLFGADRSSGQVRNSQLRNYRDLKDGQKNMSDFRDQA